ncbi:MAG: hypothetical protein PHE51_02535 [Eubacteriales bacterium]|nr:hypothetical protein [Eubacteriales bacterium]
MRRITALVLVFIIALSFVCVSAEEKEYTRLEAFHMVADLFGIKADGDISPLLSYSDWASVKGADRYLVAAVVKSGIFAPTTDLIDLNSPMSWGDYDRLTFGMNLYALSTKGYNFISGELTSVNVKGCVVTVNHTDEYKFAAGIPVIKGESVDNAFSGISSGTSFEVVYDDEGKAIVAWIKRANGATARYILKGDLYLNDIISGRLIFKNTSALRMDKWVATKDPYFTADICEETILVCDDKQIMLADVNVNYLDRPVSIIIGEKANKPCVLYVLFN